MMKGKNLVTKSCFHCGKTVTARARKSVIDCDYYVHGGDRCPCEGFPVSENHVYKMIYNAFGSMWGIKVYHQSCIEPLTAEEKILDELLIQEKMRQRGELQ